MNHPDSISKRTIRSTLSLLASLLISAIAARCCNAQESNSTDANPYATSIQPILVKYCVGCHNPKDHEANLKLHSLPAMRSGGDAGPAVVPGNPNESLILRRMLGSDQPKMPPEDSPQPSADEIEKIKSWIEQGALGSDLPTSLLEKWKQISQAPAHASTAITAAAFIGAQHRLIGKFATLDWINPSRQPEPITSIPFLGKISQIRLSPDSKRAAIAGGVPGLGGYAQIIDLDQPALSDTQKTSVHSIESHNDILYAAVLHPTKPWIATAGYDRSIQLWDYESNTLLKTFEGHNGAVYDLDFDPTGNVLVSASADETIKVWNVQSGQRLDTLSQCEAEQLRVRLLYAPGSTSELDILATGADRRIRQWRLPSTEQPSVSPMLQSIFAHEATIHQLSLSPDQKFACTAAQDGTIKIWSTQDWSLVADLPVSKDLVTSLAWSPDASSILGTTLTGNLLSHGVTDAIAKHQSSRSLGPSNTPLPQNITLRSNSSATPEIDESDATARSIQNAQVLVAPVKVNGILKPQDLSNGGDWYAIDCKKGDHWSIETFASRDKSPLDSHLEITDQNTNPILRTRLQAVRESYFTFRGKDSTTIDDFRLHRWEDMQLNQWLYAGGEVVQLWLYPRGPDSGFKVYPGFGNRFTYFGTSPIAHALNEPAWIVQELRNDQQPASNGLPIFPIYYSNDDDPFRRGGKDSFIDFVAPDDGRFYIRLRDTRGLSGEDFKYSLSIKQPTPRFLFKLETNEITLRPDVGTEFAVSAERFDGMDQEIQIEFEQVPPGIQISKPLSIEQGQHKAIGQIRPVDSKLTELPKEFEITLIAKSKINGQEILADERPKIKVKINDKPTMKFKLVGKDAPDDAPPIESLKIRPGQTVSAKLVIQRGDLAGDIAFGGDDSGRNLPHGCFVDNIGLNGLLIPSGQSTREVFITAAPIVQTQRRVFHLRANVDGNPTSLPVELIVE